MLINYNYVILIYNLEKIFLNFYLIFRFIKVLILAKLIKNLLKFINIYKSKSLIKSIVIKFKLETQSKLINSFNKRNYKKNFYAKNIYLNLSNKFNKSIINYFIFSFKNNIKFKKILK